MYILSKFFKLAMRAKSTVHIGSLHLGLPYSCYIPMYDTDKAILIEYFCHPRLHRINGGIGYWQTKNKWPNQRFAVKSPTPSIQSWLHSVDSVYYPLESECTMLSSVPMIFSPREIRASEKVFCCQSLPRFCDAFVASEIWVQLHFLHILTIFFSIPVWIAPKMTQFSHWATWPNSQRPCAMGWCVWGCRRSRPGETSPSARTALHSLRTTEGYSVFDPTPGGWSWELKCWWTSIDEHCMSHRTGTSSLGVIQLVLWQNGQRNGDTIESWSKYKWLGPIGYPKIYLMVYHGLPSFRQAKIRISSLNNDWRIAGPSAASVVCWWVSPVGSYVFR